MKIQFTSNVDFIQTSFKYIPIQKVQNRDNVNNQNNDSITANFNLSHDTI